MVISDTLDFATQVLGVVDLIVPWWQYAVIGFLAIGVGFKLLRRSKGLF